MEKTREFFGSKRQDLETWLLDSGLPQVHAATLFRRAYKYLADDILAAPEIPKRLRTSMEAEWSFADLPVFLSEHHSRYDLSVKFVLGLADGSKVEAVLMPEKQRLTLCLSSQVGCRQGCVFCHTGRMGLIRNLKTSEMVGQIVAVNRWLTRHPDWLRENRLPQSQRLSNLVFMGMGEPLDNAEAVTDTVRIATDPLGLHLGLRRISVSTAGHLEGLRFILNALPGVRIALSVHSTDDAKRSKIMPINRRWPLSQVTELLQQRAYRDRSPVMLQYTLISGVNDSLAEAESLASLADGLNAKINLIPLNYVETSRLNAPSSDHIQKFRDILHQKGLRVMVRYSKGQDIAGACGQLIVAQKKEREGSRALEETNEKHLVSV